MSDDRLADLLATELEVRHGTCATWGAHIANAIRAAVAADPSIVGMQAAVADNGYDGLWLAPAERGGDPMSDRKVRDLMAALEASLAAAKAERKAKEDAERCPGSGQLPTVGDPPSWLCSECVRVVACDWNESICRYVAKEHTR